MAEFDLTAEITAVLRAYTGDVMDKVDRAVEDCGKGMRKEISRTSPNLTGDYKRGWRCKISDNGRGNKSARVYNKTEYQLTHLLEKGHRKRGAKGTKGTGKGHVRAYVHIEPAEDKWNEEFERRCEEACKAE